jgi:hypothetical protein
MSHQHSSRWAATAGSRRRSSKPSRSSPTSIDHGVQGHHQPRHRECGSDDRMCKRPLKRAMFVDAIHLKIGDARVTNQSGTVDERLTEPAEWLTDRYATYHLRMWLIYDPMRIAPTEHRGTVARIYVYGPADPRRHLVVHVVVEEGKFI